jgi:hypothetical protein
MILQDMSLSTVVFFTLEMFYGSFGYNFFSPQIFFSTYTSFTVQQYPRFQDDP